MPDDSNSLESYLSCRLIALDKHPGVRPIGVGEILRRIIGKVIITTIKPQIMDSAGSLQLCAGQHAGCEAAIHAMTQIFDDEATDALLLVDATNAFNSINRKVLLHNIQFICPPMAIYTINCYSKSSRLFIQGGGELSSSEGTTQGDSIAMPMYAMGIVPLLDNIKKTSASEVKHAAYADDLAGAGKLKNLRTWWDNVTEIGPLLGYFPRPDKSWLIVKPELFQSAVTAFADTDLQITIDGHSYLGGYIGTSTSKEEHIITKVRKWVEQIEKLSSIAKYEPQAAYAAYVSGFRHRFTYSIRTTPNIQNLLRPLDHVIDTKLIPALTDNQTISRNERLLLALPVRLGGLGIDIVADISSTEFENSKLICSSLIREIVQQNNEHSTEIQTPEAHLRTRIIKEKSDRQKQQLQQIRESDSGIA